MGDKMMKQPNIARSSRHSPSTLRKRWGGLMELVREGSSAESPVHKEVVDRLLGSRHVIGTRAWGIAQLYFRAGLSHKEIAEVFGLTRQGVSMKLQRAVELMEERKRPAHISGENGDSAS